MQFYFLNIAESVSMDYHSYLILPQDQDPATSMQLPDVAQLVRIWASSSQLDTCLCLAVCYCRFNHSTLQFSQLIVC